MLLFTDGGCINNGTSYSKAAFSAIIDDIIISGYVLPYKYDIVDNELIIDKSISINPTNNRAELLGILHALLYILNSEKKNIKLYSDSLICVNTINIWYNNRKINNTLHVFKNLDLIEIIMYLYNKINLTNKLICIHTEGHKKYNKNFSEIEKKIWYGNFTVDKYVNNLLHNNDKFIHFQSLFHTCVKYHPDLFVENFVHKIDV